MIKKNYFVLSFISQVTTLRGLDGIVGEIEFFVEFSLKSPSEVTKIEEREGGGGVGEKGGEGIEEVRKIKKLTKQKKVGVGCCMMGAKPMFPVILVPGFACSALEAVVTPEKVIFLYFYLFLFIFIYFIFIIFIFIYLFFFSKQNEHPK